FSSRPMDAHVELNNRGSRALGPWRVEADLALHSPLKRFDQARLTLASTPDEELRLASLAYEMPLGTDGLLAGLTATVARARPDIGPDADLRTRSGSAQARLSYPLWRSRSQNLYLRGTLSWLDGRTEVAG